MNATTALKQASEHGGPVVLGAGMMLLSLAVVTSGHGVHPAAAGPSPSPAVTSPASPPTGARRSPHPTPSSPGTPADGALLAAAEPAHRSGGGSGGASSSGSEPAPAPAPEPPASSGRGVPVRLPLGVLPRVGVHLTIGGRK